MYKEIKEYLRPVYNKIRQLLLIFDLNFVDDSKSPQEVTVISLDDEPDIIEHFQPFGLSANPSQGSIGLFLSVGGNRSHGVAICIDGGDVRVKNLMEGETAVYNAHDKKIVLKQDQIEITGDVVVTGDITANGVSLQNHTHGGVITSVSGGEGALAVGTTGNTGAPN